MDLNHQFSRPVSHGTRMIRGREVELLKGQDCFMGEVNYFWRADYRGVTIVSLCKAKAECIDEVGRYFEREDE